jgi:hypothetical protein
MEPYIGLVRGTFKQTCSLHDHDQFASVANEPAIVLRLAWRSTAVLPGVLVPLPELCRIAKGTRVEGVLLLQ